MLNSQRCQMKIRAGRQTESKILPNLIDMFSVAVMVSEIVHQTDEIIIAREADLDLLVEIVLVHRQIEEKEDRTNVLETVVHNQEEKGELS